jgi:hypothetical protein
MIWPENSHIAAIEGTFDAAEWGVHNDGDPA